MAQASRKPASAARRKKAASSTPANGRKSAAKPRARGTKGAAGKAHLAVVSGSSSASPERRAAARQMGRLLREVGGIAAFFAALIVLLALLSFHVDDPGWSHTGRGVDVQNSMGRAGAWFADVSLYLLGFMAYLIPMLLALGGWMLFRTAKPNPQAYRPFMVVRLIGVVLMLITAAGLADLHIGVPEGALPRESFAGGVLGTATAWRLVAYLHPLGTTLLLLALFFCSLTFAFGTSWIQLIEWLGSSVLRLVQRVRAGALSLLGSAGEHRAQRAEARAEQRSAGRTVAGIASPGGPPPGGVPPKRWWWSRRASADADPLLEDAAADVPEVGLAAALNMAKKRAAATMTGKHDSLEAARHAGDRFDRMAEGLDDTVASTPPAVRPSKRVKPAESTHDAAQAGDALDAPLSDADTPPKRKLDIRPRMTEQKQTKLFLDVPDSDLPPLSLLDAPEPQRPGFSHEELEALSRLLEEKLAEFRISVEVVAVHPGPVITRFEMQPAPGIKASRITSLAQDIARSMSLPSVRVVEVIPGKSTIGIEVPNDHREIVQLSEMLQSDVYTDKKSPLTLALGKDISGQPVTADLARMPHLLVAGTTGSGKSVAVNAMLISLLYKATAKDVRLILIDPKMLELNVYDDIPHLLSPVVTDMKDAANALRWCVGEMERRYTIMAELKVRNLAGYNKKIADAEAAGTPIVDPLYQAELSLTPTAAPPTLEPMPMIVVVVDEFADMMMQVGKKAEEMIARIAQKARAAGIHLILATQRPSVDVITGLIKANVPTRIAFQVSQKVDSRTILDQGGAESLLGHGDMLYLPPGTALPVRVHGAFVDDHEVNNVIAHIKQTGSPNYIEEILQESTAPIPGLSGGSEESDSEMDALYDQAVNIVLESRKASISYVQRRLKIGYNRAARMIEEMESAGVISTVSSNGTREVLAPPPP